MSETKDPQARVYEKDGVLVLDDPQAVAVARAVAKYNCKLLLGFNLERARHFVSRMKERGDSPKDVLITIINVDDPCGGMLADVLMPGHDWQAYRDRGEKPIARGLAAREGIEEALDVIDAEAAKKLRETEGVVIVVIEDGVAEIFTPSDI
jgi:hypothetical protein